MRKRQSRFEFTALFLFLTVTALVIANGFAGRIFAQGKETDVFAKIEPIGDVLHTIIDEYVKDPNIDKIVEGALVGMMNSLDNHSSYISPDGLREMRAETKGEFEGIGVSIQLDDEKRIVVYQPLAESPAAQAGILSGDIVTKIDGAPTTGMGVADAAKKIRGPRDSVVQLTVLRRVDASNTETKEFTIKRGNVPLFSVKETRLLPGGAGYIRVSDFKDNTAKDVGKEIKRLLEKGMTGLILDLRWNPGGLLTASKETCELFLPKNTLVTYTQGRKTGHNNMTEDMKLYTEKAPVLPPDFPMIVLTNGDTASSAEIVTGALEFWSRAIIVGEKTFGKGSVQTIIPLQRPAGSALRLTTALYYTPAQVTIDYAGIKPDVEVPFTRKEQEALFKQMDESIKDTPDHLNQQNHGAVTGNPVTDKTVEDVQLKRAVDILGEEKVFDHLVAKYHKDTHETQVAASPDKVLRDRSVVEAELSEKAIEQDKEKNKEKDAPPKKEQTAPTTPAAPAPAPNPAK